MNRRTIGNLLLRLADWVAPGDQASQVGLMSDRAPGTALSEMLRGPFDANKAALFQAALAGEKPMAAFVDFVLTQLLPRDHKSLFRATAC